MPGAVARASDAALDATVVGLASWTLVYHVCLVADVPSTVALAAEVVVLVAAVTVWARLRRSRTQQVEDEAAPPLAHRPSPWSPPALTWVALGAGALAAVSMAFSLPWLLVWVPWLVAGAAGLALAWRRMASEEVAPGRRRQDQPDAGLWALLLAVAAAAFSTLTLRPNPDDLFYVNLSQWIAVHGRFPHHDTLFSDQLYPMANWPPLASYDAGTGALAHLAGVHAAAVDYVVVTPVATLLSVLALWRLLRAWRVRLVGLALGVAVAFLLVDGTSAYGPPGNLWLTRLWQGKVILLCVVVPVLLVHALRYVERPSRAGGLRLFAGGVAAVACSTTAVFLVPAVALAGLAPLVRRSPRAAMAGFAALVAYPVGSGVVTIAVGGRSADDFGARRQYRFDPSWFGHQVFLDGVVALVGVGAVLVGWRLLPHPAARVTSAVSVLVVGVTFVPGFTHLSYDVVDLGPTLWRLTWALGVAATVGAVGAGLLERLQPRRLAWVAGGVMAALVGVLGSPIWAADTTTSVVAPFHWQRSADSRATADWMIRAAGPGGRVLAPDGLAITVAVTTTSVKTVAPRDYYMYYLRDVPSFHYADRLALVEFANGDAGWTPDQVAGALQRLDVRVACVYLTDRAAVDLLRSAGYRSGISTSEYRCLNVT